MVCYPDQIESAQLSPRQIFALFTGGQRKRLSIMLRDSGQELFIVPHPSQLAQTITAWYATRRHGHYE